MLETVAASGACLAGASAIHMNVVGLHAVVAHGTAEQKQRWLPAIIQGRNKACFGVTEPNIGLNTLKLTTMAVRKGDRYVVNGQKVWISTAQLAHKIMLLARITPIEEVTSPTQGLSLCYTDFDRPKIEVREIEKLGRKAVDSNQLFIDGLEIPIEDRIGEEGRGFEYILHSLNPERVLLAAEATGIERAALRRAAKYAGERIVFDRPIGKNQGANICWPSVGSIWRRVRFYISVPLGYMTRRNPAVWKQMRRNTFVPKRGIVLQKPPCSLMSWLRRCIFKMSRVPAGVRNTRLARPSLASVPRRIRLWASR